MKRIVCLLFFLTWAGRIQGSAQEADTIYHGGPILTVDDGQPTAEAVAVRDGRIIAVGNKVDVLASPQRCLPFSLDRETIQLEK